MYIPGERVLGDDFYLNLDDHKMDLLFVLNHRCQLPTKKFNRTQTAHRITKLIQTRADLYAKTQTRDEPADLSKLLMTFSNSFSIRNGLGIFCALGVSFCG